jgi:hypothetical protein
MSNLEQISIELKSIAPQLIGLSKFKAYHLPIDYFETLPQIIQQTIRFNALKEMNCYIIPENYFQSFANNLVVSIKKNEIKSELNAVAPLLNTIKKENVYNTPPNYFANKEFNFAVKPTAKIVSLNAFGKIVKYSAAAAIAGVLITGAFLFKPNTQFNISNAASTISDSELESYLNNTFNTSAIIKSEDLNIFPEQKSLHEHLQNVSEDELQQFLKDEAIDKTTTEINS